MLISLDFFGYEDGAIFDTTLEHHDYHSVKLKDGIIDHIHIDSDLTVDETTEKTNYFTFNTVLNASLNGHLEGGSLINEGLQIERIRFQKRKTDELYWTDVAELEYSYPEKTFYEALDKYIQNDFEYEYSLLPVTSNVLGTRVTSDPVTAQFEGYFISDMDNNYKLIYNAQLNPIDHVSHSTLFEPLNNPYPIVSYGNANYRQSSISATILTPNSHDGQIDIRTEKTEREKLMRFLKNRKAKIFRTPHGDSMLITITNNPREEANNSIYGLMTVSFDFVEIGEVNSDSLRMNGLIEGLSEV